MAGDDSTQFSKCAHCGSGFSQEILSGARRIYCSKECGLDHNSAYRQNKRYLQKSCAHCGKGFLGKGKKVCCSQRCSDDHYNAYIQNERRNNGAHAVLKKACPVCDKKFKATSNKVYCSKRCRDEKAKRLKKQRGGTRGIFIGKKKCKTCDSEFNARKGRRTTYCSNQCRDADEVQGNRLNEARRERYLKKITGETCPVYYRKCLQCQCTYAEKPVYHHNLFCSAGCHAAYREKYKVFYYRWEGGFEITRLRICPESGYLFKPESLKQVYFSHKHAKAAAGRMGSSRRRALLKGSEAECINPFEVFRAAGWRCEHCNKETPKEKRGTQEHSAPELDHIIPISKGGPHVLENTQLLCRKCNSEKSDKLPEEWLAQTSFSPLEGA